MILIARLLGALDAFKVWRCPWRFLATNQAHLGVVSLLLARRRWLVSPTLSQPLPFGAIALKT